MSILNAAQRERLLDPAYIPSKAEQVEVFCFCSQNTRESATAFITTFCKTLSESKTIDPIPAWPHVERTIGEFHEGGNIHLRKSRQMTVSWIACAFALWEVQFVDGTFTLFTSRKEQLVDDGGDKSTVRSLLGRIRFMYNQLPRYVQRDLRFSFLKVARSASDLAAIVGESANPNMARGGNFSRAYLDEWAFVPDSEKCWAAIERACPNNKHLISSFNLPVGNFYRIWTEKPKNFRFVSVPWWEHPIRSQGLYYENNKPRSPWYDEACEAMTDDQVARELDMNPLRAGKGICWPSFSYEFHVKSSDVVAWHPDRQLYGCLDFGIGAATAGVVFQVDPMYRRILVLQEYELEGFGAPDHAENFWAIIQRTGFKGEPKDVQMFGDPAGNAREAATGSVVVATYRQFGFLNFYTPRFSHEDGRDLVERMFKQNRVWISTDCKDFPLRIADYRLSVNESGDVVGTKPIKSKATHMCDGFRFGVLGVFSHELHTTSPLTSVHTVHRESDNDPPHRLQTPKLAKGLEAHWVKKGKPIVSLRTFRW